MTNGILMAGGQDQSRHHQQHMASRRLSSWNTDRNTGRLVDTRINHLDARYRMYLNAKIRETFEGFYAYIKCLLMLC
jgi:hypothetical protein